MRPNAEPRQVSTGGVTASGEFGISRANEAHIMNILRDTLYSDKVLAVLREYSANAWDANRAAGRSTTPIRVTLPTRMEPVLKIRDNGPGLSPSDVFQVYTQYGASTKRNDDSSVGMLGIGSKSAFAYTDSFTVVSCHDGWRRTYVAVLDESDKGVMNELLAEPCDYEETGVEIQIAVRVEDVEEFESKAQNLFRFFDPRPEINTELQPFKNERLQTANGILWREDYANETWTAVMGCVPYAVDISEIIDRDIQGYRCGEYVRRLSGILYFNIGEVEIAASRERLKYSNKTKLALIRRVNQVIDDYVEDTFNKIQNADLTPWEKRISAQILNQLGLPIPPEIREQTRDIVKIGHPTHFYLVRRGSDDHTHTEYICVSSETRLIRKDDDRNMKGFRLQLYDYVVYPRSPNTTWDEVDAELAHLTKSSGIEGIEITRLSELDWAAPYVPPSKAKKQVNAKHKTRTFRFNPKAPMAYPYSGCWLTESRVPTENDVWVVLKNFRVPNMKDFYMTYSLDQEVMKAFGNGEMPAVYGYKTTQKNPVDESTLVGRSYKTWKKEFYQSLLTPRMKKQLELLCWTQSGWYYVRFDSDVIRSLIDSLGKGHPLIQIIAKKYGASIWARKIEWNKRNLLTRVKDLLDFEKSSQAKALLATVQEKYPLFEATNTELSVLWGRHRNEWLDYIHLVDRAVPVAQPQQVINIFDDIADSQEPAEEQEEEDLE